MPDPVILLQTNHTSGKPEVVGLFESIEAAQHYVYGKLKAGSSFSIWTPAMNDVLASPSASGVTGRKIKKNTR